MRLYFCPQSLYDIFVSYFVTVNVLVRLCVSSVSLLPAYAIHKQNGSKFKLIYILTMFIVCHVGSMNWKSYIIISKL